MAEVADQTRMSVFVRAGAGATVHLSTYPARTPILSFWNGPVEVTITIPDTPREAAPLTFVRDLAEKLGEFIAECERLAPPAGTDQDGPARAA
jgi:hypothetical protein